MKKSLGVTACDRLCMLDKAILIGAPATARRALTQYGEISAELFADPASVRRWSCLPENLAQALQHRQTMAHADGRSAPAGGRFQKFLEPAQVRPRPPFFRQA